MKPSQVPSTKAAPEDIIHLLKIVKANVGDIEAMKSEIHSYLSHRSRTGKRDAHNSVYAICFPTLRRLRLVKNRGSAISLSSDGEALVRANEKYGILRFKRLFAKVLLRVDFDEAHVIKTLQNLKSDELTHDDLVKALIRNGVQTNPSDDRLKRWLRYLRYVDFISTCDGRIRVNRYQIEPILQGGEKVSQEVFLQTLFRSYEKIKSANRGNVYVKIPELEEQVCRELAGYDFTTFDFREKLTRLKSTRMLGKKIIFSKPGAREEAGITIDGNYYYYISIYE